MFQLLVVRLFNVYGVKDYHVGREDDDAFKRRQFIFQGPFNKKQNISLSKWVIFMKSTE